MFRKMRVLRRGEQQGQGEPFSQASPRLGRGQIPALSHQLASSVFKSLIVPCMPPSGGRPKATRHLRRLHYSKEERAGKRRRRHRAARRRVAGPGRGGEAAAQAPQGQSFRSERAARGSQQATHVFMSLEYHVCLNSLAPRFQGGTRMQTAPRAGSFVHPKQSHTSSGHATHALSSLVSGPYACAYIRVRAWKHACVHLYVLVCVRVCILHVSQHPSLSNHQ